MTVAICIHFKLAYKRSCAICSNCVTFSYSNVSHFHQLKKKMYMKYKAQKFINETEESKLGNALESNQLTTIMSKNICKCDSTLHVRKF